MIGIGGTRGMQVRWRRGLLAVPALVGLLLFLPAGALSAQAPEEVEVEAVTRNLDTYVGRQIVLNTTITDVLEPLAFVVGDEGVVGIGGSELLVMSQTTPSIQIDEDQDVRVTGRVGRFDLEAFERAVGRQLDDTDYADWDGKAVLVLQSIQAR